MLLDNQSHQQTKHLEERTPQILNEGLAGGSSPIVCAQIKQSVRQYLYLEEVNGIKQWEHLSKLPCYANSAENGFYVFVYVSA